MNKPLETPPGFISKFRKERCSMCPFMADEATPRVPGNGGSLDDVSIIFVGEAPGEEEDKVGIPFVGRSGNLLRAILAKMRIPTKRVYLTNVVKCRPPENSTPTKKEWGPCIELLEWELSQFKGRDIPIVTLGKTASNALLGTSAAISGIRGCCQETRYGKVMPTFHPAYALRDPSKKKYIVEDIERALKMYEEKAKFPVAKAYVGYQALDRLKKLGATSTLIIDIETEGGWLGKSLSPFRKDSHITMIGVKGHGLNETYHLTESISMKRFGQWLVSSGGHRLVGHNFKFDMLWMVAHGIIPVSCIGQWDYWDTLVNYALMDEEAPSKKLKDLCQRFFNVPDWSVDFDEAVSLGKLVDYNSLDLLMTERLYDWELDRKDSIPYKMTAKSIPVLVTMEANGIEVDLDRLDDYYAEFKAKVAGEMSGLERWVAKPGSGPQVREILYDRFELPVLTRTDKTKEPATDKKTLMKLLGVAKEDEHTEFLSLLLKWRKDSKILSTYIKPFFGYLGSQHESHRTRLHPFYIPARSEDGGTVTGRLASKEPNFQNLPKDRDGIKRVFCSRFDGGRLLSVDLSQIELRILAHLSQDPGLVDAFITGKDLHSMVGEEVIGDVVSDHTLELLGLEGKEGRRFLAKKINFGIAYGAGAHKLVEEVPGLGIGEATKLLAIWATWFKGVAHWKKEVEDYAIEHKHVVSVFGRVRHTDGAMRASQTGLAVLRQAVNFMVQSAASDLMVYGIMPVLIDWMWEEVPKSLVVGNIHDAVVLDIYPGDEPPVKNLLVRLLDNPPLPGRTAGWRSISKIPITYDITMLGGELDE